MLDLRKDEKMVCILLSYHYNPDDEEVRLAMDFCYSSGSRLKKPEEFSIEDMYFAQSVYEKSEGKLDKYLQADDRRTEKNIFVQENNYLGLYSDIRKENIRELVGNVFCLLSESIEEPLVLKSEFDEEYYLVSKDKSEKEKISEYLKEEYSKSDYFQKFNKSKEAYRLQKKLDIEATRSLCQSLFR